MNFTKAEESVIKEIAAKRLLSLSQHKKNIFTHRDGWRIHKQGKVIYSEFHHGELIEQYSSKTLLGLKRNLLSKLWNHI